MVHNHNNKENDYNEINKSDRYYPTTPEGGRGGEDPSDGSSQTSSNFTTPSNYHKKPTTTTTATNGEDYSAPLTGYLYKKSSSNQWQKRYFEINGNYLIYYKNASMTRALAAVSIPQLGNITINGEINDNLGYGVIIQIDLKDKHYFMRAESYEDAENWVKHLLYIRDGELCQVEVDHALYSSPYGQMKFRSSTTGTFSMSSSSTSHNSSFSISAANNNAGAPPSGGVVVPLTTCYNPQHCHSTDGSSGGSPSMYTPAIDLDDDLVMTTIPAQKHGTGKPRRTSTTNWQKAHRSFFAFIFCWHCG